MTIDFHIHGKITNTFPFSIENFDNCIEEAKSEKIDCIALTEHCHANNFEEAYWYLEKNYKYENEYYLVNGVKVFVGVEVTTSIGLDVIFVGSKKDVFNLRSSIVNSIKENEFIEINQLFEMNDSGNLLVILAHPYRRHSEFPLLPEFVLNKIDAIEYNASDLYDKGIENMKKKINDLSHRINIPAIGGSDSHYFLQIGSIKTVFKNETSSIQEIKKQIKDNKFSVELSNDLNIRVRSQKIIKKIITKNQ